MRLGVPSLVLPLHVQTAQPSNYFILRSNLFVIIDNFFNATLLVNELKIWVCVTKEAQKNVLVGFN